MADPSRYRPAPGEVPDAPGVYRFSDETGRVIYVGKAKSLRSRLASYFQDIAALHPRTQTMVRTAVRVDWTVVPTEVDALQLEWTWIKEYDPRFNVRFRDDKSYPYLAVTVGEEFPRVHVVRGARRKGVRYFGPYAHAWAIRETVDQMLRVFPVRTCSAGVFKRAAASGRPCLLGYIDRCSAPCVGRVTPAEHRELVDGFVEFIAGSTAGHIRRLETEMAAASAELDFERAARLRDDLAALRLVVDKQQVVLGDGADADLIAVASDDLEAVVQVFYVRGGRIRGERGFVVDRVDDPTPGDLVELFLTQHYLTDANEIPRQVLVDVLPTDAEALAAALTQRRAAQVEIKVPQRGEKRTLLDTVRTNAEHALSLHKTRRASDLTARSAALAELAEALDLDEAPLRIECYDISNLHGTNIVASMVVFEDGLPRKSEYRRFSVRGANGTDDVSALREVLSRRFRRYLDASAEPTPDPAGTRKFAYPPNLVVVDGGAPQVAGAAAALAELGVDLPVVGLAKRLEEVVVPDRDDPVILSRTSEALYLLQRVRDEAHRFAITYHRSRRSTQMTTSALDEIPGVGPARRTALVTAFGSLAALRAAGVDKIAEVEGIGPATAAAIVAALDDDVPPDVDPLTGEILSASNAGGDDAP